MSEKSLRILVIDDDASVRKSLDRLIRSLGHQVETIPDAEGFVDIQSSLFDCLILDVQLPRMSGVELFESLRAAGDQTPVVFMTANDISSGERERLKKLTQMLTKPFDPDELARAIATAVRS